MNVRAMGLNRLVVLLLTVLYSGAGQADEQKCSAAQLQANLTKSDSHWVVEEDPLPPKKRIAIGCYSFQPIKEFGMGDSNKLFGIDGGKTWWATSFGAEANTARLRVVGKELRLDRIVFLLPTGPERWQSLMVQRYAQQRVRFNLSAPDGECGAGVLVLTIDGTTAAKPFSTEQWRFKRK